MNATELIKTLELNKEIANQIEEKVANEYDNVCAALEKCKERWNRIMKEYFPDEIISYILELTSKNSELGINIPDRKRWLGDGESCKMSISKRGVNKIELRFRYMWRSELERSVYYDYGKKEVAFEDSYILPKEIDVTELQRQSNSIANANEIADALDKYVVNIYQRFADISNARIEEKKKKLSDVYSVTSESKKKKVVITIEEE